MKLIDIFPYLAIELKQNLLAEDEVDLAEQINQLKIVDRCRCGDYFCAQFYTAPPPLGPWVGDLEGIQPESDLGVINIDVLDRKIVSVEIHNNSTIRKKLEELFP